MLHSKKTGNQHSHYSVSSVCLVSVISFYVTWITSRICWALCPHAPLSPLFCHLCSGKMHWGITTVHVVYILQKTRYTWRHHNHSYCWLLDCTFVFGNIFIRFLFNYKIIFLFNWLFGIYLLVYHTIIVHTIDVRSDMVYSFLLSMRPDVGRIYYERAVFVSEWNAD